MQETLMAWAAVSGRDLPWRHTRDPWAVLVSEAMLQQTQVPRVVPKYRAFMERFPTAAATAAVPVAEVVRAWAGLGYNRRAVGLHRAATAVVDRHGGVVPGTLADLLALPGVGPYTARAVLAFAFEADVGVVEVNTARVLARAVAGRPVAGVEAQALADAVVPPGRGWAWNQAMVDLGATVCTRVAPACDRCPLLHACAWAAAGRPPPDPAAPAGRQSRFAGSDRQGRGRLVDALRSGPVALGDVAAAAGWPDDPDRAARMASALVAEGLAVEVDDRLHLP
ncbi:MAG TPA: A/G-specific adenine glycosylase [Acidimicrobiales bacterium]|jgi:A/G-specific adenine glycosylase|nr:A/G-specific adenine glycosylase [Acidimicrobiales bacterium]